MSFHPRVENPPSHPEETGGHTLVPFRLLQGITGNEEVATNDEHVDIFGSSEPSGDAFASKPEEPKSSFGDMFASSEEKKEEPSAFGGMFGPMDAPSPSAQDEEPEEEPDETPELIPY